MCLYTRQERHLLAGMFFVMNAVENLLQVEYSSQILRDKKVCETLGSVDS